MLSAVAALQHGAVIVGGLDCYRVFGPGEGMARAAERGEALPAVLTAGIAVLLIWSAYSFSGAGVIRRLPLLRTALVAISAVYLIRALLGLLLLLVGPELADGFMVWSSLIVLAYGLAYAIGTWTGRRSRGSSGRRSKMQGFT